MPYQRRFSGSALSSTRRFSGSATWSHEIGLNDDGRTVYDITDDLIVAELQPLGRIMAANGIDYGEIVIEVSANGSHTPKSMYGGPDQLGWPEEYDEERLPESTYIYANKQKYPVPPEIAEQIFAKFEQEINDIDIEIDEPEPPERDYYESVVKDVAKLITEDPDIIA